MTPRRVHSASLLLWWVFQPGSKPSASSLIYSRGKVENPPSDGFAPRQIPSTFMSTHGNRVRVSRLACPISGCAMAPSTPACRCGAPGSPPCYREELGAPGAQQESRLWHSIGSIWCPAPQVCEHLAGQDGSSSRSAVPGGSSEYLSGLSCLVLVFREAHPSAHRAAVPCAHIPGGSSECPSGCCA